MRSPRPVIDRFAVVVACYLAATAVEVAKRRLLDGGTVMVAKGGALAKRLGRELGAVVMADAFTTAVGDNPADGNKDVVIMGLIARPPEAA